MPFFNITVKVHKLLSIVLFLFLAGTAVAQSGVSPYSAYGIGDLSTAGFVQQLSMGDVSLTINDPSTINVGNPATYGSIKHTIFDVGVDSRYLRIQTDQGSLDLKNTEVHNIALAFPIARGRWGLSLGVLPVSNVGYTLTDSEVLDSTGTVNYSYEGEGGLNQFYLGLGGKVWQKEKSALSLGFNAAYVFGSVQKIRKAIYPTDQGYYNTRSRESLIARDLSLDLGAHFETQILEDSLMDQVHKIQMRIDAEKLEVDSLQMLIDDALSRIDSTHWKKYSKKLGKVEGEIDRLQDKKMLKANSTKTIDLLVGASYKFGTNLHAEINLLTENYLIGTGGVEFPRDTIEHIDDETGKVYIPSLYSFGLGFRFNNKWTVAAEVHVRDWTKYSTTFDIEERSKAELQKARRYSVGMMYYPVGEAIHAPRAKFLKTIKYKAGFRYLDTYLQLNDEQLAQYGISFGVGIPLLKQRSNSWVNLGCELGERGTLKNDLIKEQYTNIYFGLTIAPLTGDRWFRKRKID